MVWCNGQTFLNCRTPFPPIDIIFLCCTVVKVASRFRIFPDRGVTRSTWIQNLCNSLNVSTWNKNGNVGHNNGSVIYPNIISVSYWYSEILASTQSPIAISFLMLQASVPCLTTNWCLNLTVYTYVEFTILKHECVIQSILFPQGQRKHDVVENKSSDSDRTQITVLSVIYKRWCICFSMWCAGYRCFAAFYLFVHNPPR